MIADAESTAGTAGAATSPSPCSPTTTHTKPAFVLQAEIEASIESCTSSDSLQLTDGILRQLMETRGTGDVGVLHEMLSTAPYNISVSYEVVQRRVKSLLDEESSITIMNTLPDNAAEEAPEHYEMEKTGETNAEEDIDRVTDQVDEKKEAAEERDHKKVARDLDMLADTVRSIVTDVVEAEASLVDADNSAFETQDHAGDVQVETGTRSTDSLPQADQLSMNGCKSVKSTDSAHISSQDSSDAAVAVDPSSPDTPKICNNAPVTTENLIKRPATNEGKSTHAPKRQKRAEYSVETRALCVRRHQTEGASYATISKELGIPHDSVRAIVRKAKRTGSVVSAPRSGRPRKTSGIVDKVILEAVRSSKQCSAKSIQEELLRVYGVKLSPETVRRRVLEHTRQRMQSISNGNSSQETLEEEKFVATSIMVQDSPTASTQGDLVTLDASPPDAVSFQHLLNGERQSRAGSEQEISSSRTARDSTDDIPLDSDNAVQEEPDVSPRSNEERSTRKRKKRAEYSIEKREQCVSLHAQGQGYRRIGKTLNMPHTTVRAIVEKAQRTGTVLPAKRSGRPRKTDTIVDKVILQAVKANERSSARIVKEQLQATYGVNVSCETIRRRVKDHSRQCMSTSTDMLPNLVADAALSQEEVSQAMSSSPSMPAVTLMTFGENGVHI